MIEKMSFFILYIIKKNNSLDMKKVKTFEAFLLECDKSCKSEMKEKKEKCPKCGKGKKCKCSEEKE